MIAGKVIHQEDGVLVHTNEAGMLVIEISPGEKMADIGRLLNRGLNTWAPAPAWLTATADAISSDPFGVWRDRLMRMRLRRTIRRVPHGEENGPRSAQVLRVLRPDLPW